MRKLIRAPETVTFALLVLAFIAGAKQSPYFLDADYLLSSTTLHVETGLLALGMTFVIVAGQIDLSVASMLTLVACLVAVFIEKGAPTWLALALGPILGAILGWFNGAVVVWAKLPSFVVTLATMAIFRGVAQILLGPKSIALPKDVQGIDKLCVGDSLMPVSFTALVLVALGLGVFLARSVFGRWVYSSGANEESSLYAGIPVNRVKLSVFTLSGFLAGLAALHIDSRFGVARFDHAQGLELTAITAVVLGGASIYGGKGSILGTFLALLLLAVLKTGMGLANVKAEYQLAVVGTLLVVAVVAGNLVRRRQAAHV